MSFEFGEQGFAEISNDQSRAFISKIDELMPLLHETNIFIDEPEIESSDPEALATTFMANQAVLASIENVNDLLNRIDASEDSNASRYTHREITADFVIDDTLIRVSHSLRQREDLRESPPALVETEQQYKVETTEIEDMGTFEFAQVKTHEIKTGDHYPVPDTYFSNNWYRRPISVPGKPEPRWLNFLAPQVLTLVDQMIQHGRGVIDDKEFIVLEEQRVEARKARRLDQTQEYEIRFDRNRFADVMRLLTQVELSNRVPSSKKVNDTPF